MSGLDARSAATYTSSINTDDLDRLVAHHIRLGQSHFNVKVGFLDDKDRDLVERASTLFTHDASMMVDSFRQ